MSHERSARPSIPDIYQVYNLTETERLYDRLSHNRFQEIIGDDLVFPVHWRGDLATLVGQPVRLRFVLYDADFYSYRFATGER